MDVRKNMAEEQQMQGWIRTLTPLVIIAVGGVVGWARLNGQVEATIKTLEAECLRSKKIDEAQDIVVRQNQLTVVKMQSDLSHIKETVDKIEAGNASLLRELRNR